MAFQSRRESLFANPLWLSCNDLFAGWEKVTLQTKPHTPSRGGVCLNPGSLLASKLKGRQADSQACTIGCGAGLEFSVMSVTHPQAHPVDHVEHSCEIGHQESPTAKYYKYISFWTTHHKGFLPSSVLQACENFQQNLPFVLLCALVSHRSNSSGYFSIARPNEKP